jgi:hypothetical protein
MNYYKLDPNPASKKWKGYENPSSYLWNDDEEIKVNLLAELNKKIKIKTLEYRNLTEGKIPPICSIGSAFIIFDANIPNIQSISLSGVQLVPVTNKNSLQKYYLLHLYKQVDCVDWEKSEIDKWTNTVTIQKWHNKRGRFFINPVLIKEKIPNDLDAFKLKEWGSAFNIIISERLKEKIFELAFDKSFLEFKPLKVV